MPQHGPFPPRHPSLSALRWRMQRGCNNARRLAYEATVLMSVHGAGLGSDTVVAVRFRRSGSEYGVVLPTDRTWNQPRLRDLAFAVGYRAATGGHRVVIASPAEVRAQPRLGNAQSIFHTKAPPACGDLEELTRHIDERGGEAPLIDCRAALSGRDARERIFGLLFGGHLRMDLTTPLTDQSVVRLRLPDQASGWEALGWHLLRTEDASSPSSQHAAAATHSL
jgi:hypothetical protein